MKIEIKCTKEHQIPEWLLEELGGNQLLAQILWKRGIDTREKCRGFLDPNFYQPTRADEFPDLDQAVQLIFAARDQNQKVCIYGDYDVDGVTSTAILVGLLEKFAVDVSYHVPHRFTEGYGMNAGVIRQLKKAGVQLIITCDCGISNHQEIALAKKLGISTLITDHHQLPPELPEADVILSPKLLASDHRAYHLPGAGMAYFLALGVLAAEGRADEAEEFLDLLSLAIVADIVPLKGENRYLLQIGLSYLAGTERMGLQELFRICGLDDQKISEEVIGFQIAPRLNAAGRMASANLSVELLLAKEASPAKDYARQLDEINTRRKELTDQMYLEAKDQLGQEFPEQPIILYRPHWHEGVLGITASKLSSEYYVPVLLMGLKEDGQTITGSARSIPGINIYDALKACQQSLSKFGGHAGAAGFSLTHERLIFFQKSIEKVLSTELAKLGGLREVVVDSILPINLVQLKTYLDLKKLAPFGPENPLPTFLGQDTEIIYQRTTSNHRHLRLIVKTKDIQHPAIWWWKGDVEITRQIDLVYTIGLNNWQGKNEIQLVVNHIINREQLPTKSAEKRDHGEFTLIDCRNWQDLDKEMPDYPGAVFYSEGSKTKVFDHKNLINRYQLISTENLVLLSTPPGLRVFKELLCVQRPTKVILAYSERDLISGEDFLTQLLGLSKYIIDHKQGRTDIYQLAVLTGEMENTLFLGLNYLAARGLLAVEFITPDSIVLQKGPGQTNKNHQKSAEKLKALLKESRAFRKYLLKADLKNIKAILSERGAG